MTPKSPHPTRRGDKHVQSIDRLRPAKESAARAAYGRSQNEGGKGFTITTTGPDGQEVAFGVEKGRGIIGERQG